MFAVPNKIQRMTRSHSSSAPGLGYKNGRVALISLSQFCVLFWKMPNAAMLPPGCSGSLSGYCHCGINTQVALPSPSSLLHSAAAPLAALQAVEEFLSVSRWLRTAEVPEAHDYSLRADVWRRCSVITSWSVKEYFRGKRLFLEPSQR